MTPAALLDLGGRSALVTGAARGLGAAIARRLAQAGAEVVLHHRGDPGPAEAVAAAIRADGGAASLLAADLSRPGEARALLARAPRPPDLLVLCAALQPVAPLDALTDADWFEMLAVNLLAPAALLPAWAARAPRGAAAVTVLSIEAMAPLPHHAHYAASKAGLLSLTRSAALEYGRRGLRVNAVAPGLIDRPSLASDWPEGLRRWTEATPLGAALEPVAVADAVLFLLSPAARAITGAVLPIDGGATAAPGWLPVPTDP